MHVLAAPTPTISPIAEEVKLGLHDITLYNLRQINRMIDWVIYRDCSYSDAVVIWGTKHQLL